MSDKTETKEQNRAVGGAPASSLEITEEALRALSAESVALVEEYFAQVSKLPVFPESSAIEESRLTLTESPPSEGLAIEEIIKDCRTLFAASRHNGHPRFFGYVASPSTPVGAYADLIASTLNQNVTSWRSAPAATEVERTVIRWLGRLVGYGENAHGLLTSGGSMANLTALIIAHRAKAQADVSLTGVSGDGARMTIYASDQVHLSILKAADIMGLGRESVRLVKSDERFRFDVRALRQRLLADMEQGFKPFCIVASAGAVNTGAIDPLDEMARVAKEHKLWFHVDGAYGALAALDASKRALFGGMERADSLSLDPHKWLYAPVDCGCLLIRDAQLARRAFSPGEADYIKVHEKASAESFAFWDYGTELSRRFRALKIWMMLRYYGSRRISEAIAHDNYLAEYFGERVTAAEDFELMSPVTLSICCFRYVPRSLRARLESSDEEESAQANAELDALNARIMHRVQRDGRAYVSNATLNGRYALRACITNFRTTRADIDLTLTIVREAARILS